MGEGEKKSEEAKKAEEEKVEKKEEPTKDENPTDGKKEEEAKEAAPPPPPPPPPPQEIVLRVYMHCEGCARKVRRCLKGFDGVEDVMTDCRASLVVVKGEKADPLKVLERLQRKSHRQVELLSPIPPPPAAALTAEEPKKPEEKEDVKTEEKTEPPVVSVVLRVHMHCDACAQEIRKRIQRMKGVESVEPDLKSSEVMVKGAFEPEKLVDYVYKRTGKHAAIVKVEPVKKDEKGKEDKEEKKPAEEGEKAAEKADEGGGKENEEGTPAAGGGEEPPPKHEAQVEEPKMELKKNEFYQYYPYNNQVYPQRVIQDMNSYPPQIFSDENPNACTVM